MMTARNAPVFTRRAAATAIAAVGVIHLALAGDYLDEAMYLGILFILGGVALLYVGARLWFSRDLVAWTIGGVAAACMFVGFLLSRTTGLPSFHESEWETSGIVTLVLEAGYLAAMGWWLRSPRRRTRAVQEAVPSVPPGVQDTMTSAAGSTAVSSRGRSTRRGLTA